MEDHPLYQAASAAIRALEGGPPRSLPLRMQLELEERGQTLGPTDIEQLLRDLPDNSRFLNDIGSRIHEWDVSSEDWASEAPASTAERRKLICNKLGLTAGSHDVLLERRPIFAGGPVVISAPWERWYTPQRAAERDFYWSHYRHYLREVKHWSQPNVDSLNLATNKCYRALD